MSDMSAREPGPPTPPLTALQRPIDMTDVVTERIDTAIDTEEFTPRLLALLTNALVAAQTRGFRNEAGMSTHEWRVLAALAHDPGQTASEISTSLSVNKALISSAVNRLAADRLIVLVDGPRRSRPMYLTVEGVRMHDRLAPIARRGHSLIEAQLDEAGVRELNALLRRLTERARELPH